MARRGAGGRVRGARRPPGAAGAAGALPPAAAEPGARGEPGAGAGALHPVRARRLGGAVGAALAVVARRLAVER